MTASNTDHCKVAKEDRNQEKSFELEMGDHRHSHVRVGGGRESQMAEE